MAGRVRVGSWNVRLVGIGTLQARSRLWGSSDEGEVINALAKAAPRALPNGLVCPPLKLFI